MKYLITAEIALKSGHTKTVKFTTEKENYNEVFSELIDAKKNEIFRLFNVAFSEGSLCYINMDEIACVTFIDTLPLQEQAKAQETTKSEG